MSDGETDTDVESAADAPRVRVRGVYATALTYLLDDVVQASPAISDRFDTEFPMAYADVVIEATRDRQGVTVAGGLAGVERVVETCRVARDTLAWADPAPLGAVFEGVVTDELGSGAVVDLGKGADHPGDTAVARGTERRAEGFLPYENVADYVEAGDTLRVQVREPRPPWRDDRPKLDTTLRVEGTLAALVRSSPTADTGGSAVGRVAQYDDLLSVDPPEDWCARWSDAADDADLDKLGDALAELSERAKAVMSGVADADFDEVPALLASPTTAIHVWFGRMSRFALDEVRRQVVPTMPGHHRTKAATDAASAGVDLVEALCPDLTVDAAEQSGADLDFPFDTVTQQFGPQVGDEVAIEHGKPDGRLLTLGRGEVTERTPEGRLVVARTIRGGGTYDALDVARRAGDRAITRFNEGKPWYATVYQGDDGTMRGTYVNICTPVEVFPAAVRYVDLHVDVVKTPDGAVRRVDDDELDDAVAAGQVPEALEEQARAVASSVEDAL